jgi:hypothetical protein
MCSQICDRCKALLKKNGFRKRKQLWVGHEPGCKRGRPIEVEGQTQVDYNDRHRQKQGVKPRICRYAVYSNGIRVDTVEARSPQGARKLAGDGAEVKLIPRRDWEDA